MNNKFKVIDENNNEKEAEIITIFEHNNKEYVIYSVNKDNENVDICVSKLEKDKEGYSIFKDITDKEEKEAIDNIVKEVIDQIK